LGETKQLILTGEVFGFRKRHWTIKLFKAKMNIIAFKIHIVLILKIRFHNLNYFLINIGLEIIRVKH